ncbi:MAG: hypothetical protein PHH77_10435 [Victivallaceae bacterium]|nr:hypothetical protein [Victivallaceae bacterium]
MIKESSNSHNTLLNSEENLTYPVIIMRSGGLDGVALQAREYRHLLNKLDINVHVITGCCETEFAPANPIGHQQTIVSRLDFHHHDSLLLFANQFSEGPETAGIEKISDARWLELFEYHKGKIFRRLDRILSGIAHNTPVLIYNLISLRHAQPAAAAALLDLIRKYPRRAFISHSADPDAERPEKIDRIKAFALQKISANPEGREYSGGPYQLPNLYHIVLNPTQRRNFLTKYKIPGDHVFEIPDFLNFPSPEPSVRPAPRKIFVSYLSARRLKSYRDSYKYVSGNINKNTLIFISPVRPVYRKRLKEAMLLAREYAYHCGREAVFVVTHPNADDKQYFAKTIGFAEKIDLPYYHLGEDFSLETLDLVYENLAAFNSIGIIASSAGGWENALNEMARFCIPFCMDSKLNSFRPLTKEIGIKTCGIDFSRLTPVIRKITETTYIPGEAAVEPSLRATFKWIDEMLEPSRRKQLVEHNFHQAYNYLSHDATLPKLVKTIEQVYARYNSSENTCVG